MENHQSTVAETKKKNWFQRHKVWTAIIGLFLFISIVNGISTGGKGIDTKPNDSAPKSDAASVAQTAAPSTSNQPTKVPTTLDSLWIAADQSVGRDGFDITYDEKTGEVNLINSGATYWDEYDIVSRSYSNFVKFGLKAFAIDGVKGLKLTTKTALTDKYGKETQEDGVIISMTKDQFSKFDWANMKGKPIHSDAYDSDFDEVFVNAAIARVVMQNPDKIKLYY